MARSRKKGKVKAKRPEFVTKAQMTDETCPDCIAMNAVTLGATYSRRTRAGVPPRPRIRVRKKDACQTCGGTGRVQVQRIVQVPRRKLRRTAA